MEIMIEQIVDCESIASSFWMGDDLMKVLCPKCNKVELSPIVRDYEED